MDEDRLRGIKGWGKRMVHRVITFWLISYCLFCFATLIVAIFYDAWAIWNEETTVTEIGRELFRRCPMLPWISGISTGALVSHFLWSD